LQARIQVDLGAHLDGHQVEPDPLLGGDLAPQLPHGAGATAQAADVQHETRVDPARRRPITRGGTGTGGHHELTHMSKGEWATTPQYAEGPRGPKRRPPAISGGSRRRS